jgi:hypothetical protein
MITVSVTFDLDQAQALLREATKRLIRPDSLDSAVTTLQLSIERALIRDALSQNQPTLIKE